MARKKPTPDGLRIRNKGIRRVRVADIAENPQNFRTHGDFQKDVFKEVVEDIGFFGYPDVYEPEPGKLMLVDGDLRREHLIEQYGEDAHIDVNVTDFDAAEAKKALATKDPIAALAGVQQERLDALLQGIEFDSDNINEMLEDLKEQEDKLLEEIVQDEVPKPPEDPITQMGDLWILGDHRLLCGDSTDSEQVANLFDGKKPMIMITDPPYGVELDQSWRDKALGDKAMGPGNANVVENDDRADWAEAWRLFPGDVVYIWHSDKFSDVVMQSIRREGFEICQQIIWNKSIMVMGQSDYHFKHEACWYAVRKGKTHRWIGDRKQTTIIEAASPNHIMSGSDEYKTGHPTQKPVKCMQMMRNHDGDVYDPFLGSGTTLIVAEQLGKTCYGMEMSPVYAQVCIERWASLTGKEPIFSETGQTLTEIKNDGRRATSV